MRPDPLGAHVDRTVADRPDRQRGDVPDHDERRTVAVVDDGDRAIPAGSRGDRGTGGTGDVVLADRGGHRATEVDRARESDAAPEGDDDGGIRVEGVVFDRAGGANHVNLNIGDGAVARALRASVVDGGFGFAAPSRADQVAAVAHALAHPPLAATTATPCELTALGLSGGELR